LVLHPIGHIRLLAIILLPILLGMLLKRNAHSFRDDLCYLVIFTTCVVSWWRLVNRKRTPHA